MRYLKPFLKRQIHETSHHVNVRTTQFLLLSVGDILMGLQSGAIKPYNLDGNSNIPAAAAAAAAAEPEL